MNFGEKIKANQVTGKYICIGLDYEKRCFPYTGFKKNSPEDYWPYLFFKNIIEATIDIAGAYKINPSFYLSLGHGAEYYRDLCFGFNLDSLTQMIADTKSGDVAHTNNELADYYFNRPRPAGAITVNPYTGFGNLQSWLDYPGRGVIVFCEATGRGNDLQMTKIPPINLRSTVNVRVERANGDVQIYEVLRAQSEAEKELVLPETISELIAFQLEHFVRPTAKADVWLTAPGDKPERIARLRAVAPNVPFLIPGVGAQGGGVAAAVKAADGNCLITISRSIIYGWLDQSNRFGPIEAAQRAAVKYNHQIEQAMTELGEPA